MSCGNGSDRTQHPVELFGKVGYLFYDVKASVDLDNGPGFVADIVHQAFEPYVTSKPKGTGLGLAIVKKLVEEHGGQITARNREQGGAEISILIPISMDAGHSIGRRHDHRRERA